MVDSKANSGRAPHPEDQSLSAHSEGAIARSKDRGEEPPSPPRGTGKILAGDATSRNRMNVPFPDTNMRAPNCEFSPEGKADVRVLFDLRIPGAVERLHRERELTSSTVGMQRKDSSML